MQAQLSLLQGLAQAAVKVSAQPGSHLRLNWGRSLSCGYRQDSVPCGLLD